MGYVLSTRIRGVEKPKGDTYIQVAGGGTMEEKKAITPANLAREWGFPLKKVKDAIKAAGIEPDSTRGACKYYTKEDADRIRSLLNEKK